MTGPHPDPGGPAIMITVRAQRDGARYAAVAEVVEPICTAEAETAAAAVELVVRGLNEKFPDGWWRAAGQHPPNTVPVLAEQLRRVLARRRQRDDPQGNME